MNIAIIPYEKNYIEDAREIWNSVVRDGVAFPQTDELSSEEADSFFAAQDFTALAVDLSSNTLLGLYILHPNNIGRCGHIGNASYAVSKNSRGLHIGEKLVIHSKAKAKELGFTLMQFNAVVKSNLSAQHIYEKHGFVKLGVIPKGFKTIDNIFEDIILYYTEL